MFTVLPEDVVQVFPTAAVHRLKTSSRAGMNHGAAAKIIQEILTSVKQPRPEKG